MSNTTDTPAPWSLRDLPLPAKLVVSGFLLAVGLGYTSAMIQLHMGHSSKDGNPLPSPQDVVAIFAGKVWKSSNDPRSIGKLESIISGAPEGKLDSSNMAPAFFANDGGEFDERITKNPADAPTVMAEREGERKAVKAWIVLAPDARKKAYEDDAFALTTEQATQPVTPAYRDRDVVKIRSLLDARCARCHNPKGSKANIPLHTHDCLAKFIPATMQVPEGGGWVDSGRQMSLGALTQSTHAHLLSFAMLFSLTGLTFAFTRYPRIVRLAVAPMALAAQVADVSCWWLARLPESGPYFAMAILGTGGVVGIGLGLHIVLSLFDMYGWKGKLVLAGMFLAAAVVGGLVWTNVVAPHLQEEADVAKAAAAKADAEKNKPADSPKKDAPPTKHGDGAPPKSDPKAIATGGMPPAATRLEKMIAGDFNPKAKFGGHDSGMVRAFFDKEPDFKKALEMNLPGLDQLRQERKTEQALLIAWARATPAERKSAYNGDKFPLPPELKGSPFAERFKGEGETVKVKTLIDTRCACCHAPEKKQESWPLTTYAEIEEYLKP